MEEAIHWLGTQHPSSNTVPLLTSSAGFKPASVTYTSDNNFGKLYTLAEKLIELGKAYICYCSKEDITLQRAGKEGKGGPRFRCKHADQDMATNLLKFRAMRDGNYEPGSAILRMKQDLSLIHI